MNAFIHIFWFELANKSWLLAPIFLTQVAGQACVNTCIVLSRPPNTTESI